MSSFNAKFKRRLINEEGKMEVTLEMNSYADNKIAELLNKDIIYNFSFKPLKAQRSNNQNNLLWLLIHDISVARNTDRATSEDDWEVYLEALERAQAKFEVVAIKPQAIPMLQKTFRAVKELNRFITNKGVEMAQCKVFYGSSQMDVQEMGKLIDTVLDMAAEEGVAVNY